MPRPWVAAIVATCLVLAACSSSPPAEQAAPTSAPTETAEPTAEPTLEPVGADETTITETESPTPAPPPVFDPAPLEWSSCDQGECASLAVPVDHDRPDGETLELAVARVPATGNPADRIGSLFLNPGGPGASGVDFVRFAGALPTALTERFDVVSWDPRGVGRSSGLICEPDIADDLNDQLDDEGGLADDAARLADDAAAFGTACGTEYGDLLDHVGTLATVHDLDLLRRAVGDDGLTFVGYSYGSRVGAVYATVYPEQVRGLVLDGAFPPELTPGDLAQNAADFELALERADARCAAEPTCAAHVGGLLPRVQALLDSSDDTPDPDRRGVSDRAVVAIATIRSLYRAGSTPAFAEAVMAATNGDLSVLEAQAAPYYLADGDFDPIFLGANQGVMCADGALVADEAALAEELKTILEVAPVMGPWLGGGGCIGWPGEVTPLPAVDSAGAPTILVVGTTFDPATPYRWAEQLAEDLDEAVLVAHDGDGHTAFPDVPCVTDVVVPYLLALDTPGDDEVRCRTSSGLLGLRILETDDGLEVTAIEPGSAADRAGLLPGDLILSVDLQPLQGSEDIFSDAGQTRVLAIERADNPPGDEVFTLEITADPRPWWIPGRFDE